MIKVCIQTLILTLTSLIFFKLIMTLLIISHAALDGLVWPCLIADC